MFSVAGPHRPSRAQLPPRFMDVRSADFARTLVVAIALLGDATVTLVVLDQGGHTPLYAVLAVLCALLLAALQTQTLLRPCGRPYTLADRCAVAFHAALCLGGTLAFGKPWQLAFCLFAGCVLAREHRAETWVWVGAAGASVGLTSVFAHGTATAIALLGGLVAVLGGVLLHMPLRLAATLGAVQLARSALTDAAVADERRRIARDLHDLLGYNLSAISVKAQLVDRLLDTETAWARTEIADVLDLTRQALADVRSVSHGYRAMSLEPELASVVAVLGAARIKVTVLADHASLPTAADAVLATVLREGATNVLRHSRATVCRVTAVLEDGHAVLTLTNDGAPRDTAADAHTGGLDNLRQRVESLDGEFTAGPGADGTFRITARVPVV